MSDSFMYMLTGFTRTPVWKNVWAPYLKVTAAFTLIGVGVYQYTNSVKIEQRNKMDSQYNDGRQRMPYASHGDFFDENKGQTFQTGTTVPKQELAPYRGKKYEGVQVRDI